ncbi:mitochondrial carrier domain-containing protein [Dipodascopsis tothii]|uniref:mitochondrial carrier domain-containing protein n=1 Tax=Dipodascopsis tothii TaxID=44089 RepID=UPI0034CDA3E9
MDTLTHALSGSAAGLLAAVITHPLLTLSTRAQLESNKEQHTPAEATPESSESGKRRRRPSMATTLHAVLAREGLPALYAGVESAAAGVAVTNFVYYYFYEASKRAIARVAGPRPATVSQSMAAGAVAGVATVVATNPIWVVNTRQQQARRGAQPSALAILRDIVETDPRALLAGITPALVLVINPVLQYTIFEQARIRLARRRKLTPWDAFVMGAVGKLVATVATYPYITLKSREHVYGRTRGLVAELRAIVGENGVRSLYAGLRPKLVQSVLTAALLFFFKERLMDSTARAVAFVLTLLRRRRPLGPRPA